MLTSYPNGYLCTAHCSAAHVFYCFTRSHRVHSTIQLVNDTTVQRFDVTHAYGDERLRRRVR